MLVDIPPVNRLRFISKDSSAVKSYKDSGRGPENVLLSISSDVNCCRLLNSSGSVPDRPVFESKSRDTRFERLASSLGSVPTKLFSSERAKGQEGCHEF